MLYFFVVIYIIRIFEVLKATKYKPLKNKVMKTFRVLAIIASIDSTMFGMFRALNTLKESVLNGSIKPNQALKVYRKIMERAAFYNHISYCLECKYPEIVEQRVSLQEFESYVLFFEA